MKSAGHCPWMSISSSAPSLSLHKYFPNNQEQFHLTLNRKTARNFNVPCAKAGKKTFVEVEEIVEVGEIPAEDVHLPSVYVQGIIKGDAYEKRIEVRVYTHALSIQVYYCFMGY